MNADSVLTEFAGASPTNRARANVAGLGIQALDALEENYALRILLLDMVKVLEVATVPSGTDVTCLLTAGAVLRGDPVPVDAKAKAKFNEARDRVRAMYAPQ